MNSLFVDQFLNEENFNEILSQLGINQIPLRKIDDLPLLEASTIRHQEIAANLNEAKVKVLFLDIIYDYYLDAPLEISVIKELTQLYKTRKITISLPMLTNFESEKDAFIEVISNFMSDARKEKINVVFKIDYSVDSAVIAYILRNIKNISFYFNPGECFMNKKSITSYYRLIRRNIDVVGLFDMETDIIPTLLGYGKALILDTIDKLNKDRFKGDIIYDYNLDLYLNEREKAYKRTFFRGRKQRKIHLEMDKRLKLSKEDSIALVDLLESQLTLIRKYQTI